jgi:hypothetical protein
MPAQGDGAGQLGARTRTAAGADAEEATEIPSEASSWPGSTSALGALGRRSVDHEQAVLPSLLNELRGSPHD